MTALHERLDYEGAWQQVDANHPALPGHFPGRPVVPGVVLLDRVREALTIVLEADNAAPRIAGLPAVKFLSPVLPEQRFRICLQGDLPRLRFRIEADDGQLCAQGQISLEMGDTAL